MYTGDDVRLFSRAGGALQVDTNGYTIFEYFERDEGEVVTLNANGGVGMWRSLERNLETIAYEDDFLRFSKLSTREDIKQFADEFGYLCSPAMAASELISYWKTAILDMNRIVTFWQEGNQTRALEVINLVLRGEEIHLEIDPVTRSFSVAPFRLRGLLYLQAANAVLGSRQYRQCVRCGGLFSATRSTKKFCSMACKSAWHAANRKGN